MRGRTGESLGSPVVRAARVWGGYAQSATYRLVLADHRRAFFKGIYAGSNDHMRAALIQEERAYRELGAFVGEHAPAFLGAFREDDWHVILLEDLGPATVPPWDETKLSIAARDLAAFHRASCGQPLPAWLPRELPVRLARAWDDFLAESGGDRLASLAGEGAPEVERWLASNLPVLGCAAENLVTVPQPDCLLHLDVRSDNLRIVDGRLRLFDWNWVSVGPPELDLAAFAQSVALEGGGSPERLVGTYDAHLPVRAEVLTASVAAIAAHFLRGFWSPEVPGLPRLRRFQRLQARETLTWAAARLGLAKPEWLDRLSV